MKIAVQTWKAKVLKEDSREMFGHLWPAGDINWQHDGAGTNSKNHSEA
jgi:hypothetical protein